MRDTTIFYRSFYEAIKELDPKHQQQLYNGIFEYSLDFKEQNFTGVCKTVWTLIKPQLDANLKRFENGSKPKLKQNESEIQAKPKRVKSKNEANNNNNNNNNDNNNEECVMSNNNKEITNRFIEFWNLYDKKVSKDKCEKIWAKLLEKDIEKIFETLPSFLAKITDKKYQPHPTSYLNQKRWEDELQEQEPIKSPTGYVITPHTHNRNNYYSFDEYIGFCEAKKIEPKITQKEFYAK
jgi:hypothetical protein